MIGSIFFVQKVAISNIKRLSKQVRQKSSSFLFSFITIKKLYKGKSNEKLLSWNLSTIIFMLSKVV